MMKLSVLLATVLLSVLTKKAIAQTYLLPKDSQNNNAMRQITNVNQLRDVEPTAWAYEALRSLVERYGCIVGYPDQTFRGDRPLNRWEFAAGLNACINKIESLIQENVAVLREDIDKLKRLAKEFESELAVLGTRIDNLEERVAFLEDHQFSSTTKLSGTVIFALGDTFGGEYQALNSGVPNTPNYQKSFDTQTFLAYRLRLNLATSFAKTDKLRIRLQASNIPNLKTTTGTDMARFSFDGGSNNNVVIDDLYYKLPDYKIDKCEACNLTAWVSANGLDLDDVFDPINPFLQSSDFGSLSREQRYNPLIYRGTQGAGGAIRYAFSHKLRVTATYLTGSSSADPTPGNGFFNGAFSTGFQFDWQTQKNLVLAFSYLHNYQPQTSSGDSRTTNIVNLVGGTGSGISQDPFQGAATTSERFGLQGNWLISPRLNLSGWGGYALAQGESVDSFGSNRQGDRADIWTWNAALSFIDLGKDGAVFTLSGGLPPVAPYVEGSTADSGTSYIIQAQYGYPFSNNINITPGFFVVLNPNNNDSNSAVWVGVIRTTFSF